MKGEDGYLSAAKLGLGESGETIETLKDLEDLAKDCAARKVPYAAACVDSLKPLSRAVMISVLGSDRLPQIGAADKRNEWGEYHFVMERLSMYLRRLGRRVIATCPSDKSMNQLDGKTYITPDLPGRGAAGSAGWFDFVGYVQSDVMGPGKIQRKIIIKPNTQIITRQRLPRPIVTDIDIPEGGGGWQNFLDAIQKTLE